MFGIRFIKIQPTTYLLQYRRGKIVREGVGLAFFYYAPSTSLVAIPIAMLITVRPRLLVIRRARPNRHPTLALQLSPFGIRELDELHGVDLFGGKRRFDPFDRSLEQRPQAWTLFGRLGAINYQNQLDRDSGGEITLKRSGPSVGGTRISFGIRRRF